MSDDQKPSLLERLAEQAEISELRQKIAEAKLATFKAEEALKKSARAK